MTFYRTLLPEGWLTVPELARVVQGRGYPVRPNTVRSWIYTGHVDAIQFGKGGQWIFPLDILARMPDTIRSLEQVKDVLGYR